MAHRPAIRRRAGVVAVALLVAVSAGSRSNPGWTVPAQAAPTPPITGRLIVDPKGVQTQRPGGGNEVVYLLTLCSTGGVADAPDVSPAVRIDEDGDLAGTCELDAVGTTQITSADLDSQVEGHVDLTTGQVTDLLLSAGMSCAEATSCDAVWTVDINGATGSFSSPTEASGTASFTYVCDSRADNLRWCFGGSGKPGTSYEQFTGTLSWRFVADAAKDPCSYPPSLPDYRVGAGIDRLLNGEEGIRELRQELYLRLGKWPTCDWPGADVLNDYQYVGTDTAMAPGWPLLAQAHVLSRTLITTTGPDGKPREVFAFPTLAALYFPGGRSKTSVLMQMARAAGTTMRQDDLDAMNKLIRIAVAIDTPVR